MDLIDHYENTTKDWHSESFRKVSQVGAVDSKEAIADALFAFAKYDESYVETTTTSDKEFTDIVTPVIGECAVKYVTVKKDKLVAWTAADNA